MIFKFKARTKNENELTPIALEALNTLFESLKTLKLFDDQINAETTKESFLDTKLKDFLNVEIKFKDFYYAHQMKFLLKVCFHKQSD